MQRKPDQCGITHPAGDAFGLLGCLGGLDVELAAGLGDQGAEQSAAPGVVDQLGVGPRQGSVDELDRHRVQ